MLESTSDYWRPFFYVLEGAGLSVWLVNAKQVKNVSWDGMPPDATTPERALAERGEAPLFHPLGLVVG